MFKSVHLTNIKSFADCEIPLGPVTVLLGTNASGKSNIRDAFRFLHAIGRGYRLGEILGEKFEGGDRVWNGTRGGSTEFLRHGERFGAIETDFAVTPDDDHPAQSTAAFRYRVGLGPATNGGHLRVADESLEQGGLPIYRSFPSGSLSDDSMDVIHSARPDSSAPEQVSPPLHMSLFGAPVFGRVAASLPAAPPFPRRAVARALQEFLDIRFVDLDPEALRRASYIEQTNLGDHGENLSSVLKSLEAVPNRKEALVEWLRALTPLDILDIEFVAYSQGRIQLELVEENGTRTSAESASDGTLKFLGLLATVFTVPPGATCFIEEIDNGIHPSRLSLLAELIETQTERRGIQVIATSHSPALLGYLSKSSLCNALLVYRSELDGASRVKPICDLPGFDYVTGHQSPGSLMTSRWFENTVAAIEAADN